MYLGRKIATGQIADDPSIRPKNAELSKKAIREALECMELAEMTIEQEKISANALKHNSEKLEAPSILS